MNLKDFIPPVLVKVKRSFAQRITAIRGNDRFNITSDDYDAAKYWNDRHRYYGENSLLGVGHAALPEEANYSIYQAARYIFSGMVGELDLSRNEDRILEIGFGSGFYTRIVAGMGIKDYLGVDISDYHIPRIESEISAFKGKFKTVDAGSECIEFSDCALIFMIDVSQHIVNTDKLVFCLRRNVRANLRANGTFIVTDSLENRKYSFYEASRDLAFYEKALGLRLRHKPIQFRDKYIFSFMHK